MLVVLCRVIFNSADLILKIEKISSVTYRFHQTPTSEATAPLLVKICSLCIALHVYLLSVDAKLQAAVISSFALKANLENQSYFVLLLEVESLNT